MQLKGNRGWPEQRNGIQKRRPIRNRRWVGERTNS
jgi:hypothetical protein